MRAALESRKTIGSICESLIVLPEAFNIGKGYRQQGESNHEAAVLAQIQDLARAFQVTFVAGLIIREPDGPVSPDPPYSSSYLIDGTCVVLVSRKFKPDGNATTAYTVCDKPDHQNPIWHGGACLIALICIDSDDPTRKTRLLETFSDEPKIICIPACMNGHTAPKAVATNWASQQVILANSDSEGCGSFVSKGGAIVLGPETSSTNKVLLYPAS